MRKAVYIFGLGYILWGLWQLLSVIRIISFYREFGTTAPFTALLLPAGVLGYGIIQIVCSSVNFQNKKVYTALFILGVAFVGFWVMYVLIAGSIANKQIDMILNEVGYSENRF